MNIKAMSEPTEAEQVAELAVVRKYADDLAVSFVAMKALNAELVEALDYWLPDESWMMEKYPNHKTDAWGTFYEHAAVLAKAKQELQGNIK